MYDRRSSLLRKDLCDLTRMFSETTTKLRRTKNPTCSYLSIARLQSSLPADLKHIILVFWNFHHLRSSTQVIPVKRKPFWQLDVHTSTTVLSLRLHRQKLMIMLQYVGQMGYEYESLPIRKDRYTLLLGSPFIIILKKWLFLWKDRFANIFNIRFAQKSDSRTFLQRKRQLNWIPTSYHFQKGTTSLHIEYKVACMCRCSMQCLFVGFINLFIDFKHCCIVHNAIYIWKNPIAVNIQNNFCCVRNF